MLASTIIEEIRNGKMNRLLLETYTDESLLDYQRDRYIRIISKFIDTYGDQDVCLFSIPGRCEVSGNHTDHQHGCVLACGVNTDILAVVCKDSDLSIVSNNKVIEGLKITDLSFHEKEKHTSLSLVKGVINRLKQIGYEIGGFKAVMESDVPVGSGMSSSAAFENAIGTIINHLYNEGMITPMEIAKSSQYAENVYFGKPCGLMDQCACCYEGLIFIDFHNFDDPEVREVARSFVPFNYSLCLVNTRGSHANLGDEYKSIPDEMRLIANYFDQDFLVDVSKEDIIERIPDLRKRYGDRPVLRALHMKNESERVRKQADALQRNDINTFLKLVTESGNSSFKYLQNVYTNTDVQNQPLSIALMISEELLEGHGVCRIHGGGFAGTILAFVKNDFVDEYHDKIEKIFGEGSCLKLQISPKGACRLI